MRANLDTRLSKLESARPAGRVFYLWQPKTNEELEAVKRERGVREGDTVYLFEWAKPLPVGQRTAAE
jgi:hypothetical protein